MTSVIPIIIRAMDLIQNIVPPTMCPPRKITLSSWGEQNGKGNYAERSGTAVFKIPTILHEVVTGDDNVVIWFFLMGMIAGAVGWHKFAMWIGRRMKEKQLEEAFRKRKEESHD